MEVIVVGDITDLYVDTMVEEAIIGEQSAYEPPMYWRMGNGQLIAISEMTTRHLNNTIRFLKRQIDGSAHDDFCWDNINAMEKELRKRGISSGKD